MNTAIISLTTIPERIEHIEPCIKSLFAQGLPIYLWAVRKIKRSPVVLDKIPGFLKDYGVHVEIVDDCGPITKLLPALKAGFKMIITADDDVIYGENWARRLLFLSEKIPNAALGFRGRIFTGNGYKKSKLVLCGRLKHARRVHMLTGTWGILYPAKIFNRSIYTDWKLWPDNDDLVIAAHLRKAQKPCYVIPSRAPIHNADCRGIRPLFEINTSRHAEHNDAGMKRLGLEG